jgi:UDP-GlcNAc:undecaprenyl-phosphate GlcNAc-1-phosphate transferase
VIQLTAAAGTALAVSLAATPLVRRLAFVVGATDMPDARRIHVRPTARAGGVGVALATAIGLLVASPTGLGTFVLAGAGLLLAVGLLDDLFQLRASWKLVAQIGAAILAVGGGLRLSLFGLGAAPVLSAADAVITVFWIVLITNALNLTDGLDGLASGIGLISLSALAATALRIGNPVAAEPAIILAAALVGFLVYNFNPASIFLGDSGSLLIGYALATLPLVGGGARPMRPLAVLLLVAVPATDTLLAIARRFLSRCLRAWGDGLVWHGLLDGLRNTTSPDRRHIHHRLIDLGLSQRHAVLLLYVGGVSTAALAHLVAVTPTWPVDAIALVLAVTVIWLVQALGFDELQPARSDLILPVLRRLGRRRRLVVPGDLALIGLSYSGALALSGGPHMPALAAISAIGVMAATQLAAFALFGVYRTAWWLTGLNGFGMMVRACAGGTIAGYVVLRLFHLPAGADAAIVHFLLIMPAATLARFSYVLLTHAARHANGPERALICGTAAEAQHALGHFRRNGMRAVQPIGFIELNARLQGRQVGTLPVLGTLDALPGIVAEQRVKHLVLAEPSLDESVLDWVRAVCRHHGVRVHRYVEAMVEFGDVAVMPVAAHANGNGNGHPNGNGNGHKNGNGNGHADHHLEQAVNGDGRWQAASRNDDGSSH